MTLYLFYLFFTMNILFSGLLRTKKWLINNIKIILIMKIILVSLLHLPSKKKVLMTNNFYKIYKGRHQFKTANINQSLF